MYTINKMKVVILAGGKGTRLRPLTLSIPKPLIPIGDTPILEILIKKLKKQGLKDIILSVGYKSDLIINYFGNGKKFGVKINYFKEKKIMGTAACLKVIKSKFKIKKPILVLNGDIFTEINYKKMISSHKENKADVTVGLKEKEIKVKYGVYDIKNKKIERIREKPTIKINASIGINIFNHDIIDLIPKNKFYDIPDLINKSLKLKKKVFAYNVNEFWMAVDHIIDLEEANVIIKKMKKK